MKLVINYDLINEIKNAQEPYGLMKIVRSNKREWICYGIPLILCYSAPAIIDDAFIPVAVSMTAFYLALPLICDYLAYKYEGDFHKEEAKNNLLKLISALREQDINTDYELLLDSRLYQRNYKLNIKDKAIEILESKYILIPTYNYMMEVRDTSILQEHIVGSDTYVLSLGTPVKKLKLAYAMN